MAAPAPMGWEACAPCDNAPSRLRCAAPAANAAGGFPGQDVRHVTRGLKAGRAAEADGWGPGLEPGRRSCPPCLPWFSRVPCPWFRLRGHGCVHGPDCPQPAIGQAARRCRPARAWDRRDTAAVQGLPGQKPGAPTPGPAPPCAVCGPPSEDVRRRMPKDAAPRIPSPPGPRHFVALPATPRRGALSP